MTPFKKTQETIQAATEQLKDSSTVLVVAVGVAIVVSVIALVFAVNAKK